MRNEAIHFGRLVSFDYPSEKNPYAKCTTDCGYWVLLDTCFNHTYPVGDLLSNQIEQLDIS